MAKSYKTTGCFRFFVFILILAPIVYLGASYYNGQDGIQNIKNIINRVKGKEWVRESNKQEAHENKTTDQSNSSIGNDAKISELNTQVSLKDKEINALIQQNLDLKQQLKECESKSEKTKAPK